MELSETLKDWLGTFWRILILPTPKTFTNESEKAGNKFGSAIGWAVFIPIYSYLIAILAGYVFNFTMVVVGLIIIPLVIVLASSVTSFILQRVFHRKQYLYDKILYIFTAILVLFQLIVNPITFFIPSTISTIFNYIVIVYQFGLFVIAIKAIAKINYWQAIITILSTVIVGAIIFICAIPLITSIMSGVNTTLR